MPGALRLDPPVSVRIGLRDGSPLGTVKNGENKALTVEYNKISML